MVKGVMGPQRHRWAVRKISGLGKRESLFFLLSPTEPCSLNFTDPEGTIEILQQLDSGVECNYLVTVYLGYGIEAQVSLRLTVTLFPMIHYNCNSTFLDFINTYFLKGLTNQDFSQSSRNKATAYMRPLNIMPCLH